MLEKLPHLSIYQYKQDKYTIIIALNLDCIMILVKTVLIKILAVPEI